MRTSRIALRSGLALACAEQGPPSATPTLVMLHGPTDSWRSYEPVLAGLSGSIHAVAVSQRGHGNSDKPQDGYGVQDLATDVVDLADALGLERFVLVGHSASCLVARRVAVDHPERVAGLVLEASPVTLVGNAALAEFVGSVVVGLRDPIDPGFARSFVLGTSSAALPPEVVGTLVAEVQKVPSRVWRGVFSALLAYDDTSELEHIRAPALLVWGDRDALVPRDAQEALTALLPDARLVVYRGVGHTPRWERPLRFAEDLSSFVRAVGEPSQLRRPSRRPPPGAAASE